MKYKCTLVTPLFYISLFSLFLIPISFSHAKGTEFSNTYISSISRTECHLQLDKRSSFKTSSISDIPYFHDIAKLHNSYFLIKTHESTAALQLLSITSKNSNSHKSFKTLKSKITSYGNNTSGKSASNINTSSIITTQEKLSANAAMNSDISPDITLNTDEISLSCGQSFILKAYCESDEVLTYESSKPNVVMIDNDGMLLARRPGTSYITVSNSISSVQCRVSVDEPVLTLSDTHISLYSHHPVRLSAETSSGTEPAYKSSNPKIASVNEYGVISPHKHGKVIITVTADGIFGKCSVTVLKPVITLNDKKIFLQCGQYSQLSYSVSSDNQPSFISSKPSIATVDSNGLIHALRKGTTTIKVSEDGVKKKCKVKVR